LQKKLQIPWRPSGEFTLRGSGTIPVKKAQMVGNIFLSKLRYADAIVDGLVHFKESDAAASPLYTSPVARKQISTEFSIRNG
jgi:hypothetical protein